MLSTDESQLELVKWDGVKHDTYMEWIKLDGVKEDTWN